MDRKGRIKELQAQVAATVQASHEFEQTQAAAALQRTAFSDQLKALRAELIGVITAGAKKCADGSAPIGVAVAVQIKGKPFDMFEVGTWGPGPRSRGFTPEAAVEAWNRDEYID